MTIDDVCKVIIVDDDRIATAELSRRLITYSNFEIKGTACNAAKGRKLILEQQPDLLFLDVELPDMLGFKLLEEMRDEVVWDMKVIFYSAYDKYMLQALRESAFDYLLKPFEDNDLTVIIERYQKSLASQMKPPSLAVSIKALLPAHGTFMISTVTGFRLLHLEEIGFFEYIKEKRQWQVTLFNQSKLSLKKNTKAEDIISYSESFVQVSQSAIVNVHYLAVINDKRCQLYPPFNTLEPLVISRGFLKDLQEKFCLI